MKTIQITVICALLSLTALAQKTNQNTQEFPNTIEVQFNKAYKKSNSYQIFKVIKKERFLKLQKNVLDSISEMKKEAVNKQQTINSQQETIASLESKIAKTNEDLKTSMNKEDNISLFGIQLSKTLYNTVLWGIIAVLLGGLLFFMFKFNSSNSLTKEAKNSLSDIEQELEQYKKKSLEKEQKLRRQLQDEINKQRGI